MTSKSGKVLLEQEEAVKELERFFPSNFEWNRKDETHSHFVYHTEEKLRVRPRQKFLRVVWLQLDSLINFLLQKKKFFSLGTAEECFRFESATGALVYIPNVDMKTSGECMVASYVRYFLSLCEKANCSDEELLTECRTKLKDLEELHIDSWDPNQCESICSEEEKKQQNPKRLKAVLENSLKELEKLADLEKSQKKAMLARQKLHNTAKEYAEHLTTPLFQQLEECHQEYLRAERQEGELKRNSYSFEQIYSRLLKELN